DCAVVPDEPKARAAGDRDADAVQGREAAETLRHLLDFQERIHGFLEETNFLKRPRIPSGAATTNHTSITPTIITFISPEIVTVTTCWIVLSRMAPITGPR